MVQGAMVKVSGGVPCAPSLTVYWGAHTSVINTHEKFCMSISRSVIPFHCGQWLENCKFTPRTRWQMEVPAVPNQCKLALLESWLTCTRARCHNILISYQTLKLDQRTIQLLFWHLFHSTLPLLFPAKQACPVHNLNFRFFGMGTKFISFVVPKPSAKCTWQKKQDNWKTLSPIQVKALDFSFRKA